MNRILCKYRASAFLAFVTMFFCACTSDVAYIAVLDIPSQVWTKRDRVEFVFNAIDTLSEHNLDIILRHSRDFGYKDALLEVTTLSPQDKFWVDTIRIALTNDDAGEWRGRDFHTHFDLQVNYRRGVRFARSGEYLFKIKHLNAVDTLIGIISLGIVIEKNGKE